MVAASTEQQGRRRERADRFAVLLGHAGLAGADDAGAFVARRTEAESLRAELTPRRRRLDNEFARRLAAEGEIDRRGDETRKELDSLATRRSNIPGRGAEHVFLASAESSIRLAAPVRAWSRP